MIGQLVGSYRIMGVLGSGGMGQVYLAQHQMIGRSAAIKVLLPELSHNREVVERFFNEARASALIRHPGIVDILDFGLLPDGSAYLVMELLEGESLAARLQHGGRLPEAHAVAVARQAAGALAAAHASGIIHRDLKPDNLYLVPDADLIGGVRVKILDFGIAKLSSAGATVSRTRTGAVMGSPLYMSPEQSRGARAVDARADIYSLGCVFFEMLAGRPPFLGEGAGEVIGKQIYEKPPRLRSLVRGVSGPIEALISRMLAKRPDDRPRSMNDVVRAIDKATQGRYATGSVDEPIVPMATPAPGSSTTLGGGTGEVGTPPRQPGRRRALWLALASLPVIGGGVAAILMRGGSPNAPARSAAPVPPPIDAAPRATAGPAPARDAARDAASSPPQRPERRYVKLRLTSNPPGAAVAVNGVQTATTPCDLNLPFSADVNTEIRLSLHGYHDKELQLLPDQDRVRHVQLRSLRRKPAPAAPPRSREKGEPVDPFR